MSCNLLSLALGHAVLGGGSAKGRPAKGRFFAILCVGLCASAFSGAARAGQGEENQSALPADYFERAVRPLLVEHCGDCHGAETQEHGLRLDRPKDLLAGGVSGPVIQPGKPEASLLITAIQYGDPELQMPPEKKLPQAAVDKLVLWIKSGAPLPDIDGPVTGGSSQDWSERKAHWAFTKPVRPTLPVVKNQDWAQQSLDLFVLARLEKEGTQPATPADKRTLLRRVTFDLIGLPPTPAELAAFAADESPTAYAKVVDRLLASPQYGERWGRHWLDVARYADSNGLDENVAHGNAWRYRNWVIQSLNADQPFDAFITEQLAGDLLAASAKTDQQRNRQRIATGFLSLGPKVLAEVDEQKMEMDIVDEQIDTVGRAVMGLTLGCARCHDHKFDPITTRDYYALAGVFKSTHTMDSFTKIARWHEHEISTPEYTAAKQAHLETVSAKRRQLDTIIATATEQLRIDLGEGAALPAEPEKHFSAEAQAELAKLREQIQTLKKSPPQPPTAMGVKEGSIVNSQLHIRGSHLTKGDEVPRGMPEFLLEVSTAADHADHFTPQLGESGRLQLANWLTQPDHPLTARVMVNRVWRWHFGRGIVETTDNFGLRGSTPSHPQLLDYLASEFAQDWSVKNLHRRIVLSATYQTGDRGSAELTKLDPDNRLFGRSQPRRLEAEEIRDAMLGVSDSLDLAMGSAPLNTENRKHIFDHTSKDATEYANHRRSVYLPVVRNHLHESFTLFDYTDASVAMSNRSSSTVPSQALYLLNSPFVTEASERLATRIELSDLEPEQRIRKLYQLTLSRMPTTAEVERAKRFLSAAEQKTNSHQSWQLLCQSMLICNEFFYVR